MNNEMLILFPSNWLLNAGVIGMLNLLNNINENVKEYFYEDGIKQDKLLLIFKKIMKCKKCDELQDPFNQMPLWHWRFAELSFFKRYGNLPEFIYNTLKATNAFNKSQMKKKLKIEVNKNKFLEFNNYINKFECLNYKIDEVYKKVFVKNPTLSIEDGYTEILKILNEQNNKILYIYRKFVGAFFSKGKVYLNLFNPNNFFSLDKFIDIFSTNKFFIKNDDVKTKCIFCNTNLWKTEPVADSYMSELFPGLNSFPNAFWNNDAKSATNICSFCKLIILHHHLSFINISDSEEIFINAPSFKLMYELNNLIQKLFGFNIRDELKTKREILATSVIEYARKIQVNLQSWAYQNIEIIIKNKSGIEFYSLPDDVMKIISDRKIASLLSDIGEFSILNKILDKKNSELIEIGYNLLKLSNKEQYEFNEKDQKYINSILTKYINKKNLSNTANKIFKLYSLIEEKK